MSVSGDLSTLTLADLFQNIENHGRSGTLTVQCENSTSHVFFREGKVSTLVGVGRTSLADRLVASGLLTQRRLDAARKRHKAGRKGLVEALVADRVLREEDVHEAGERYLFEDAADLVAGASGEFKFREDEQPPEGHDADELALQLRIAAGPIVLEASRRADHWVLIRKFIPSDAIHFITRKSAVCREDVDDPELGAKILEALDGTRSVQEVADLFPQQRFITYKLLSEFVRDRLVRCAEADDLARVASALSDTEPTRARRILAHGLEAEPHHEGLLAEAAALAEQQKDPVAAATYLKTIAHRQLEAGQIEEALHNLEKARELTPEDPAVWERTLALAIQHGERDSAVDQGLRLVDLYRGPGLHNKAQEVLERLLRLQPDSLHLHQELARTLVDTGAPQNAVRGLIRQGKKLLGTEDYPSARLMFAAALGIDAANKEAGLSIEMIDKEVYARRRERKRRVIRWLIAGSSVALLGMLLWRETTARRALAEAEARIGRERYIEWRDYRAAILLLEGVAFAHPLTATAVFDVPSRLRSLEERAKDAPAPQSAPAAGPGR